MEITKVAARVIGRNAAKALGDGWSHDVQTVKSRKSEKYIPVVYHSSRAIGLHYVPDTGWVAAVGLKSALTEGDKQTENQLLAKVYSAVNINPRRAVIECVDRARRLIVAIQPQLEVLDRVNRQAVRAEDPANAPAEPPTFDQWWATQVNPADKLLMGVARAAWMASKEGV
jgi:hypothetical protein